MLKNNICCEFDSQIAYIVNNIDDELNDIITIIDYLKNKELQNDVKNKKKYLLCPNKESLTKYESDIRKCYFKHVNSNLEFYEMSEWHKNWQSKFERTEISIGNRRADAVVHKSVIEFQHSNISKTEINNRTLNYTNFGYKTLWVIDCNNCISIEKTLDDMDLVIFNKKSWICDNFIDLPLIYLSFDNKIALIDPKNIKSRMIVVGEWKSENEYILSLKKNMNIFKNIRIENGKIYYNQRGAGCGKTYESVQLMNNDKRFDNKSVYIYLTKMHSAKEVIYNELKSQNKDGKLKNLLFEEKDDELGTIGKQYKIYFENIKHNKNITLLIGTIDSFMYAIGDKSSSDKDYFVGIVKSIRDGYINTTKNGGINYSCDKINLNKKCLIIIDEAQDLGEEYIEAFCKIINKTNIDVYVIGDKLQSISNEHNIHTFIENNNLPTDIIRNYGENKVMRFHNDKFIEFVNDIVPFDKYKLPQITKICENKKCKYKHEDIIPYEIFGMNNRWLYRNQEFNNINKVIDKIINYIETEITKYNYLPHNFMFIFPILSDNYFAITLESRLQGFWIDKFNDTNYHKIANMDKYWVNKINDNKYYKYVYLHKSEDGKPINLKESEKATRILSIHASKGNGCDVVFLLGIDEHSLKRFSKNEKNIVYDSLLHVAITRQKKSIYIGIDNNNDDISNRFLKYNIKEIVERTPSLSNIKTSNKFQDIIDYSLNNDFASVNNIIKKMNIKLTNNGENTSMIIDWGHHIIRYCVFYYYFMSNIVEKEIFDNNSQSFPDQFTTKIRNVISLNIQPLLYKEYYLKLKEIISNKKNDKSNLIFPILCFSSNENSKHYKYKNTLVNIIKNIQNKIKNSFEKKKFPELCPIETVLLLHILFIMNDGTYSKISIMDIYNIIYYYDHCSNSIDKKHEELKCICKTVFTEGNNNNDSIAYKEIKLSIVNHYENIKKINKVYENFKKYINNNISSTEKFRYNTFHLTYFGSKNKNFSIFEKYDIIAHSDNYVIHFVLKPQINKLNYSEIMFDAVFNKILLLNQSQDSENNYIRFNNKKILTCLISLDSVEPDFISLDIEKDNKIIINNIKKFLVDKYSKEHIKFFNLYNFCKNNKPKDKNSISFTIDNLNEYTKLPNYIFCFFDNISTKILESNNIKEREKILDVVNNEELFLSKLNEKLIISIDSFLLSDNNTDF